MTRRALTGIVAFAGAVTLATVHAQVGRGTTEWLTAGGDAQRTFWVRADPKISVASMSKPGFELQWSRKLDAPLRGPNGLQSGVTANGVTLFVPMSVVANSSNTVYALDNDTGYMVWQRTFDAKLPLPTAQCPGGITAGPTRIVPLTPPPITPALAGLTGGGRAAQGYRSVIGEPGEGAPVETRGGGAGRGAQGARGAQAARGAEGARGTEGARGAAPAAPQRASAPPQDFGIPGATAEQLGNGRGLARPSGVAYVIASDGVLHVMGLPSGKDIQKPAEFIPANAKWTDTIAIGTMLYATSSGNCGGAPDAVWAIDLESEGKPVTSWKNSGGPIVGRIAFGTDGTLFAAVGAGAATGDGKANAVVALDPKTLQVKDWFTQPGAAFVTGPTVFTEGNREIVAAATKDGRVLLLNAASLGGADHATPLHASSPVAGGIASDALATWQELTFTPPAAAAAPAGPPAGFGGGLGATIGITTGARWIVATTPSGIASLKVSDSGGTLSLAPGWTAAGLTTPSTPIVVNGVVFALSTGRPSSPAALEAYEGTTGKLLWDSKGIMKGPAAAGSFWSAMSQIYVGANDGTLYAFGFTDERR